MIAITKAEFDAFYDQVLGDDWYIEEWNVDFDVYEHAQPDTVLRIDLFWLAWLGSAGHPTPTTWITSEDLDRHLDIRWLADALDRWRRGQKTSTVAVEIPTSHLPEFRQLVAAAGGQIIGGQAEVSG